MKFNFKFESVLNVYRHEEKQEQQKLGALIEKKLQMEKVINNLRQKVKEAQDSSSAIIEGSLTHVKRSYARMHEIQNEIWEMQSKVIEVQKEIEEQRTRLLHANRKVKVLEKLKSKEKASFVKLRQHHEQLQQNEIATQMYNRSR